LATQRLGVVWQTIGDYRQAAECLGRAAEKLRDDPWSEQWMENAIQTPVYTWDKLVWCLVELGEFAQATARAEEVGRIVRDLNHPRSLVFAYRSLGLVSLRRGDLMQATPPLERSVEHCRITPAPTLLDVSAAYLGYAYALSGRLPEGVALLEEAAAAPAVTGVANHPLFLAYLGEAHLLAGRRDEALGVARRALDLAHRQKERGNEAWVLRLLGDIAAQGDPPDVESAHEYYRRALDRADELGMRPLVAHCHLGLGKLYRRTGKREQARERLATATVLYREMGMGFWLQQGETELQQLG
jgi:tetratricopeptide (TPR) repeat protein